VINHPELQPLMMVLVYDGDEQLLINSFTDGI
jgi:hypothetical protein